MSQQQITHPPGKLSPQWIQDIFAALNDNFTELYANVGGQGPPGEDGADGAPGADGADGREVELQTSATHIQWRLVGDPTWTDLVALSTITGPQGEQGEPGEPGAGGGGSGQLAVAFHADGSANLTLTNQANAEQFLGNSNRNITRVDLTNYTQYRLVARVITGSASVNSPRLYAQFHTSFTTTVATFSPLGAGGDVALSLTTAGHVETAWTDLATAAKADVFLTVLQNGGDAALDPALGHVAVEFR